MVSPRTKGRMLNRDISDSKGFAKLSPAAAVLFCMMVPHYSPHGKINGDPGYLKGEVCPRIPYLTPINIPKYLKEINENTSVKWFGHDGRMWIHSTKFLTEHQQINPERVGPDLLPSYSGVGPELLPPEVEVEVEVEVKGEGEVEGNSGLTPEKQKFLDFVVLTGEEHAKLIEKFGEAETAQRIERLNNGIGSKGYKYKSHYHTILSWAHKDEKEKPTRRSEPKGAEAVRNWAKKEGVAI